MKPCPLLTARDPLARLTPEHRASLPGLQPTLRDQYSADGARHRAEGNIAKAEACEGAAARVRW